MENNEIVTTGEATYPESTAEHIQAAQIEMLTRGLFDLYVFIMQLKANKRTKVPSIALSQEQGKQMLEHINYLTSITGKWIEVTQEQDGSFTMNIVDIPKEVN